MQLANPLLNILVKLPLNSKQSQRILSSQYDMQSSSLIQMISLLCSEQYHKRQQQLERTQSIVSFINSKVIDNLSNDIEIQFLNYWTSIDLIIKTDLLKYNSKKFLAKSIQKLLNYASVQNYEHVFQTALCLLNKNQDSKKVAFLLIEGFFTSDLIPEQIQAIALNLKQMFRQIGVFLLKDIVEYTDSFKQQNSQDKVTSNKQSQLLEKLKCFESWLYNYYSFISVCFNVNDSEIANEIFQKQLESEDLLFIIDTVYFLTLKNDTQLYLTSNTGNLKLDNSLNMIKCYALKLHSFCIQNNYVMDPFDMPTRPYYLRNLVSQIQFVIKSISYSFTKQINNEQLIMAQMINFINQCLNSRQAFSYFHSNYQQILFRIVFKGLKISNDQLEDYQDNFFQFVKISENICEQLIISQDVKSQTAKLLISFVNQIGCGLTILINQCIQGINIKMEQPNPYFKRYQQFSSQLKQAFQNCYIQTYLIILSILVRKIQSRNDLKQQYQHFIRHVNISKFQDLDVCRFYHLLKLSVQILSTQTLQFFIEPAVKIIEQNKSLPLSHYCFDYIFQCISKKIVSLESWKRIFQSFSLLKNNNRPFYSFICKLLQKHINDIPEQMVMEIMNFLINRISQEYLSQQTQKIKKLSINTSQSLNAITRIFENVQYLEIHPKILQTGLPLLQFMNDLKNIQYSKEIITIYCSTLKRKGLNQQNFKYIENCIEHYLNTQQFDLIVEVLSCFLSNGQSYLKNHLQILNRIMFVIEKSISDIFGNTIKYQNVVRGFLLLQILVDRYGDNIKDYTLIKNACQWYLDHDDFQKNQNIRILKTKVLNVWALSAIYSNMFNLNILLDIPLTNVQMYDLQVYIYSVSRIFQVKQVQQQTKYLLNVVLSCIKQFQTKRQNIQQHFRYSKLSYRCIDKFQSDFKKVDIIKTAVNIVKYTMNDKQKFKEIITEVCFPMKKIKQFLNYCLVKGNEKLILRWVHNPQCL